MRELLTLCGFETHEIEAELPRIEKAFQKLGLTSADIERGKQRITEYYDIKLQGIRKALGLMLRDVVNTVLAREDGKKKVIVGYMSPGFEILATAMVTRSNEINTANITGPFQFVMGCIFDKMVPILEAAEQKWLKSGKVWHCGNVKTLVGVVALDLIPKPDFMLTSGELCDTAPKTLNLFGDFYGIPVCSYDSCHDRLFTEFPDSSRLIKLSAKSTRNLAKNLQNVVGFEITDDMLWEVLDARGKVADELRKIQDLIETSDPMPISPTHEMLFNCVNGLAASIPELEKPRAVLNMIYNELKERVDKREGVVEKGAPRIISMLPHHFTDPRWEHLPCKLGIALLSSESGFFPMHGNRFVDFPQQKPDDPFELLAKGLESSLCQSTRARVAIILEVCKRLHVDGVWDKYHVGCRINVGDAIIIKDEITRELNIPVLLMEWEGFDPRVYNEEQISKRFEIFRDAMINSKRHN
jgi:benzoyl-CoA reductase/2-hydroxyglutaryl-CoA dehydratase subunit BcrC/BadD/HgdB